MARILVIDDEPTVRQFLRRVLEAAGHQVAEAATGERAARAAVGWPADLVFCDLFMPERDGLEVIRDLGRAAPGLPVIAMSGGSGIGAHGQLTTAEHLGAAGVLHKPFTPADVLAAVGRLVPRPADPPGAGPG